MGTLELLLLLSITQRNCLWTTCTLLSSSCYFSPKFLLQPQTCSCQIPMQTHFDAVRSELLLELVHLFVAVALWIPCGKRCAAIARLASLGLAVVSPAKVTVTDTGQVSWSTRITERCKAGGAKPNMHKKPQNSIHGAEFNH